MGIKWSLRARTDLRDPKAYIAKDSPYYAKRVTERIIASVEKQVEYPKIGRSVPEAESRDDVRELIYRGYRIIYRIQSDHIFIVTILHGSRDLASKEVKLWDVG